MNQSAVALIFELIRSEICGTSLSDELISDMTPEALSKIYNVSKQHDVAHIVASALLSRGLVPDGELKASFSKEQMTAVFRHAQLRHELDRVSRALEGAGVDYIPLKGSVLRRYYPRPELRTSCDIDVYVRECDVDAASTVLVDKLNMKPAGRTTHDVSFHSASKTHLELHYDLIENDARVAGILSRVFELSSRASGSEHRFEMSPELFVFYHIAHMAKHFSGGGCGVRPFIDLWVLKHRMGYDPDKLNAYLSESGLLTFAESAMLLSNVWFDGAEHTELTRNMQDYITSSSIYGKMEDRVAIKQSRSGGKIRYIISRLFPPCSQLKRVYPRLQKYPVLYPFYLLKRIFGAVFRGRSSRMIAELKYNSSVSNEKQKHLLNMLNELGL